MVVGVVRVRQRRSSTLYRVYSEQEFLSLEGREPDFTRATRSVGAPSREGSAAPAHVGSGSSEPRRQVAPVGAILLTSSAGVAAAFIALAGAGQRVSTYWERRNSPRSSSLAASVAGGGRLLAGRAHAPSHHAQFWSAPRARVRRRASGALPGGTIAERAPAPNLQAPAASRTSRGASPLPADFTFER